MDNLVQDLAAFMLGLIVVESIVYVGGLYFISYLSKRDEDDSTNSKRG
jgi:hypothetical protein